MSSNTSPVETGVSTLSPTIEHIGSHRGPRSRLDVERELLYRRIEELERELARERQQRTQVVDHYERLLEREREEENERSGLLGRLF